MKPQTFIFFGPSGSGKGEQTKRLMEVLKQKDAEKEIVYIETGENFRKFIEGTSYTAEKVRKVYDEGKLLPEFMPIYLWANNLIEKFSGNEHVIFDGTPRKPKESEILDSTIKFYNMENPVVISIEVAEEVLIKRMLQRGRRDDNEEDIKNRLSFYKTDVIPTIEYFKNNPYYKFISVNGEKPIEEVHKEIMEKVGI